MNVSSHCRTSILKRNLWKPPLKFGTEILFVARMLWESIGSLKDEHCGIEFIPQLN